MFLETRIPSYRILTWSITTLTRHNDRWDRELRLQYIITTVKWCGNDRWDRDLRLQYIITTVKWCGNDGWDRIYASNTSFVHFINLVMLVGRIPEDSSLKRAICPRSVRHLGAIPWIHILRIWLLYRMGLAMGLIKNLARFKYHFPQKFPHVRVTVLPSFFLLSWWKIRPLKSFSHVKKLNRKKGVINYFVN